MLHTDSGSYTQVLIMASLLGPVELHADNSIALGKSLFQLVASRTLPQQAVPTRSLMCETFTYSYGEVAADAVKVPCKRDYFFRPRICFGAWRYGKIKELNCLVGAHPLEDVIHIHAWVQLHLMHMGHLPPHFYFMPGVVPRSPELVPGRAYPYLGEASETGVICVSPGGMNFAFIRPYNKNALCMDLECWQLFARDFKIQVAPLIHRRGAVVKTDDALRVLVPQQPERNFEWTRWDDEYEKTVHPGMQEDDVYLNYDGEYALTGGQTIPWDEAHRCLVALGTHVLVEKERVQAILKPDMGVRMPRGAHTHLEGWIRYPESCDAQGDLDSIFVAFRVMSPTVELEDVLVLPVRQDYCTLCSDAPEVDAVDYLHI